MAKYCFDTSGLSHPYEELPEDIYGGLWAFVRTVIENGDIAVTTEIFDEMCLIPNGLGAFIATKKAAMLHEVAQGSWDWKGYLANSSSLVAKHKAYISEYSGGSPKTICLNDMTGVCLAATLKLPLVSMEVRVTDLGQSNKRKIPNICDSEKVEHWTFNEFLRKAGYKG